MTKSICGRLGREAKPPIETNPVEPKTNERGGPPVFCFVCFCFFNMEDELLVSAVPHLAPKQGPLRSRYIHISYIS